MLFTDANFIYFIIILFALYYLKLLIRYQIPLLIIASLYFYYVNTPAFTILLLFSAAFNIVLSWLIVKSDAFEKRKLYVTIGVILNVVVLVFFKYGYMLVSSILDEPSPVYDFFYRLALPIGISFYTFEGISLVVDTFKARNKPDYKPNPDQHFFTHCKNVLLFISFFPHLISGPILRANHFFPQLKTKSLKDVDFKYCFKKLVLGYFLKMVVANNLHFFTFWLQKPYMDTFSSFTLFVLMMGFAHQLFADFAGYSYIALGLAGLFGYQLEENFSFPFVSKSFTEVWRRWHMTLSSFLRYYVYTNFLGGGRKGRLFSLFNIFLTMVIAGLWHGAKWTFAIWGAIHGAALVIEHFVKKTSKNTVTSPVFRIPKMVTAIFLGYFCIILPSMALFRFPSLHATKEFFQLCFNNTSLADDPDIITYITVYSIPILAMHVFYLLKDTSSIKYLFTKADYWVYGPLLFAILINSAQSSAFIYFKF